LEKFQVTGATSVPVYALALFNRFNNTFPQCFQDPIKLEQAQLSWFTCIKAPQIGTNLECISNQALQFTKSTGVHNVVYALCVFVAYKMLEGYDGEKIPAYIAGLAIFQHDAWKETYKKRERDKQAQGKWDRLGHAAKYDFNLFESAFYKQMQWNVFVTPEVYIKHVEDLFKFPDIKTCNDKLQQTCLRHKQETSKALLLMLKEAAGDPPPQTRRQGRPRGRQTTPPSNGA